MLINLLGRQYTLFIIVSHFLPQLKLWTTLWVVEESWFLFVSSPSPVSCSHEDSNQSLFLSEVARRTDFSAHLLVPYTSTSQSAHSRPRSFSVSALAFNLSSPIRAKNNMTLSSIGGTRQMLQMVSGISANVLAQLSFLSLILLWFSIRLRDSHLSRLFSIKVMNGIHINEFTCSVFPL